MQEFDPDPLTPQAAAAMDRYDDEDRLDGADSDQIAAIAAGQHHETIHLGLGDFVFYSVLVAKAAQYDFSALAACFLVILLGLSSTLLIVSVFRNAIPALPVSIGLGVLAYLFTR